MSNKEKVNWEKFSYIYLAVYLSLFILGMIFESLFWIVLVISIVGIVVLDTKLKMTYIQENPIKDTILSVEILDLLSCFPIDMQEIDEIKSKMNALQKTNYYEIVDRLNEAFINFLDAINHDYQNVYFDKAYAEYIKILNLLFDEHCRTDFGILKTEISALENFIKMSSISSPFAMEDNDENKG